MQMTILFVGDDLSNVILKLQNDSKTLFKWFNDNQTKANPYKSHFICSSSIKNKHHDRKRTNWKQFL